MDASIPGRYGYRRRSEQRQAALEQVWERTQALLQGELDLAAALPCAPRGHLRWAELPPGLDPGEGGGLDDERAERKRAQVESLASYALGMMLPRARVVEFGAGSGHLGVLLAHLRPDADVVLVEVREHNSGVGRQRVEELGLTNCRVFHGSVDDFAACGEGFDLAVGLHTCGLLADAVLALAVRRGAAACIVPCCYGQVAGKEDHQRGEGTAAFMHPCSQRLATALGGEGTKAFPWCAKAADFTPGKGGTFSASSPGFGVALRCMRTVDADRLWWAREHGYDGSLALLEPLGCSPKCSVLRIRPPERPREGLAEVDEADGREERSEDEPAGKREDEEKGHGDRAADADAPLHPEVTQLQGREGGDGGESGG